MQSLNLTLRLLSLETEVQDGSAALEWPNKFYIFQEYQAFYYYNNQKTDYINHSPILTLLTCILFACTDKVLYVIAFFFAIWVFYTDV